MHSNSIKDTTRIPAGLRGDEAGLEGRGYPRDGLANLLTIKPAWLARGDRSNQVRCVVVKPCQEELVLRPLGLARIIVVFPFCVRAEAVKQSLKE